MFRGRQVDEVADQVDFADFRQRRRRGGEADSSGSNDLRCRHGGTSQAGSDAAAARMAEFEQAVRSIGLLSIVQIRSASCFVAPGATDS